MWWLLMAHIPQIKWNVETECERDTERSQKKTPEMFSQSKETQKKKKEKLFRMGLKRRSPSKQQLSSNNKKKL